MSKHAWEGSRHVKRMLVGIVVTLCVFLPIARAVGPVVAGPAASTVPATYYGPVLAGIGFTPAPGMQVTAFIDGRVCGQSWTQQVDDQVVYSIKVAPDSPGGIAGCGDTGRMVWFEVAAVRMAPLAAWDTSHVVALTLSPATVEPFMVLTKTLNTAEPVRIGQEISFTIRITNTSQTPITVLPLRDTYSTTFLSYGFGDPLLFATPPSQGTVNDGELDWPDLTASFGKALGPNEHFEVIVTFRGIKDTTELANGTVNTATVYDAFADPDGPGGQPPAPLPVVAASDEVKIAMPTGIGVSDFSGVRQGSEVLLTWRTAVETNMLGFNLLRQSGDGEFALINRELLFAEHAGANQGATYSYTDNVEPAEIAIYILQVALLDGSVELAGQVEMQQLGTFEATPTVEPPRPPPGPTSIPPGPRTDTPTNTVSQHRYLPLVLR